jgi:hypothetical protein
MNKLRRLQEAFAAHLRHVTRLHPVERHRLAVLIVDNAPSRRGKPIEGGPGEEAAPGIPAAFQRQLVGLGHRVVLEGTPSPDDAQQFVREPGASQAADPVQPALFPDDARHGPSSVAKSDTPTS